MGSGSRLASVPALLVAFAAVAAPAVAQGDPRPFLDPQTMLWAPLPPATLLEGFRAPIGAIVTIGRETLGEVKGISVDVREIRDSTGGRVRGVAVRVEPEKGAAQMSYVDADELPPLLHGLDQLIGLTTNPTQFRNFEMHYATKGELEVTASSSRNRGVVFAVEVGRPLKADREDLTAGELLQLRTLIEAASQRLATMPSDK